jgi:hypothetical protein
MLFHDVPFQISDGSTGTGGIRVSVGPTAAQKVELTQDTVGNTMESGID